MEIPFGNCGVPLEILHSFRTESPENSLTRNFRIIFFWEMVSTSSSNFSAVQGQTNQQRPGDNLNDVAIDIIQFRLPALLSAGPLLVKRRTENVFF